MRNFLLTLGVALAACAVSFVVFYAVSRPSAEVRAAVQERDAMQWLRAEFHLTDAQFAEIQRLHDGYNAQCAEHCAAIMAARRSGAPAAEVARLESVCERSMAEHFHRVAAVMDPAQGRRYLEIVLPRVAGYDHHGAPSLRVDP